MKNFSTMVMPDEVAEVCQAHPDSRLHHVTQDNVAFTVRMNVNEAGGAADPNKPLITVIGLVNGDTIMLQGTDEILHILTAAHMGALLDVHTVVTAKRRVQEAEQDALNVPLPEHVPEVEELLAGIARKIEQEMHARSAAGVQRRGEA